MSDPNPRTRSATGEVVSTLRPDTLAQTFAPATFASPALPEQATASPHAVPRPATRPPAPARPVVPLDFSLELPKPVPTTAAERLVAHALSAPLAHPISLSSLSNENIPLASLSAVLAQRDAAQTALAASQKEAATLRDALRRREAALQMVQERMRSALQLLSGARDHWHAEMAAADLEAASRMLAEALPGWPVTTPPGRRK